MNQTTIAILAVGAIALYVITQKQAAAAQPPPAQPTPTFATSSGGKDSQTVAQPKPTANQPPDVGGLINTFNQVANDPNVQGAINWLGGVWNGLTGGGSRSVYA